ncbi:sodium/calcium exchanger 3-like [Limulus polyphemus]|uniref:Sodium/calcium exchanger 3-like n=1 Tax=Limulus polyphemus TaxID=6850 RepID=A0ABM1T1L3_LIMPO|nr:sodium/calcium exchanger 3-like [Limulus polyphemus]
MSEGTLYNYTCSDKGLLLPIINEYTWSREARAFLYLIGLLYCFLGVAIIADIFMCAIEKITSKTRKIVLSSTTETEPEIIEVRIWNDTVANLTLMALGSSAPEILLSIIEIVGNGFKAGDLGPGTIVGSAAFNLLAISAVCVVALPHGETRRIKSINVFATTSFFSVFAYIWLLIILVAVTPNEVELWEALVTLFFFPGLVALAFLADKNFFMGKKKSQKKQFELQSAIDALRALRHNQVYQTILESEQGKQLKTVTPHEDKSVAVIEFNAATCAVVENVGRIAISIRRRGKISNQVSCRVETIDGTATAGEDYVPLKQIITFQPNEEEKKVFVEIINDNQWEPDETFFLKLVVSEEDRKEAALGRTCIMEITILNDDEPGILLFKRRGILVKENAGNALIPVIRKQGADGIVTVRWRTIDETALNGRDYIGGEGELRFEHGEVEKFIEVPIIDDFNAEKDEHFEVEIFEAKGGAVIGQVNRVTVTITNDDDFNTIMDRLMMLTNVNVDSLKLHSESWVGQLKDAMNVNGGDLENATRVDYVMHFLTFGWKVCALFLSFVPPTSLVGGWATFFFSLGMIGILTAIVGDLASIFGCLVGLKNTVTAITFVALGTSLPDLFASKAAAQQEKYADNAIGNVTGSNSVNVFLGLGLPWVIAAIYWAAKGKVFDVPSGSLSFSVGIYSATAMACIVLLMVRRYSSFFGRAELGGPINASRASFAFLLFLWFLYILLSSLHAYGYFN